MFLNGTALKAGDRIRLFAQLLYEVNDLRPTY